MRRHRILVPAVAGLALAAIAVAVTAGGSTAAPSRSQALFKKTLLADSDTTPTIQRLLREGGGFVAPEIEFADVTADGRSDAVVLVESGGAAGAVALYVLSTEGESPDSDLRAVYRSQRLYRASVRVSDAALILRTPRFGEGDDVCCPAKVVEQSYAWEAAAKTMRRRSTRELPGPKR